VAVLHSQFQAIDWAVVVCLFAILLVPAVLTRRLSSTVAGFLVAGRGAGRYLTAIAGGMSGLGAITILAVFQMYHDSGFSAVWWGLMGMPVGLIIAITGWGVYRFRETRVLTLAQFLEARYSRRFRIFSGFLGWLAGIVNFGIFPASGAWFFIYYCGLPETFQWLGLTVSTFGVTTATLILVSVLFCFLGGQVTVILTDFIAGLLVNIAFVALVIAVFTIVPWEHVTAAYTADDAGRALVDPLQSGGAGQFNVVYFLIGIFLAFYNVLSWQGSSTYHMSARDPHEARMGQVLAPFRGYAISLCVLVLPVYAWTTMHHPAYADMMAPAQALLDSIGNDQIRSQMTVPVALTELLPPGLLGLFAAVMLGAFISTHDTYLLSWGGIFIQDVVLPLRGKPLPPDRHIRWIRGSVVFVALFIFLFSLFFQQTQHLLMFTIVTAAIYMGGAGAVILGGLYWPRGTTLGAWVAMITGSSLAVGGIIADQLLDDFPLSGQEVSFWASVLGVFLYVTVSLLDKKPQTDLAALLHRGSEPRPSFFELGKRFSRADKAIFALALLNTLAWFALFVGGTLYGLSSDVGADSWLELWKGVLWFELVVAIGTTIWFTIGGILDLRTLFKTLREAEADPTDDGQVH